MKLQYLAALIFSLAIALIATPLQAKNRILHYDPAIVELEGTISTRVYAGPPNYECTRCGDRREVATFMTMKHTIDVYPFLIFNDLFLEEVEKNVKKIQIAVGPDRDWRFIKKGKCVHLKGTLFHRLTGHHHTRVLIFVTHAKGCQQPGGTSLFSNAFP